MSLVDGLSAPLALLLLLGVSTRAVALVLAVCFLASDLVLNHWWSGPLRYNDNVRFYFFEDLAIIGGLLLLLADGAETCSLVHAPCLQQRPPRKRQQSDRSEQQREEEVGLLALRHHDSDEWGSSSDGDG